MSAQSDRLAGALADALLGQGRRFKAPRTITVVCHGPNNFDVFEGEEFCNHLCWDEMLGQVVHLTHPQIQGPRYGMVDVDRYQLHLDRMRPASASEQNARMAEECGDSEAAIRERAAQWRAEQGMTS